MTQYVVLVQLVDQLKTWLLCDEVEARNDVAAIREVAGEKAGTYVAIPARSFTPRVVRVETHTRIRLDSETP